MDRNTVIGLVLIGVILSVFTIVNQPSDAEIKKEQKELALQKKQAKEAAKADAIQAKTSKKAITAAVVSSISKKETKLIRLENEKLIIDFSTKGGKVAAVYLKEFESYKNFAKKDGKITALELFRDGDALNELVIPLNGKKIHTGSYIFDIESQTKNAITFTLDLGNGQLVKNRYSLNANKYDINYAVNIQGFGGKVSPKNIAFNLQTAFRKSERLFSEQRKMTTICFNNKESGLDYLSLGV